MPPGPDIPIVGERPAEAVYVLGLLHGLIRSAPGGEDEYRVAVENFGAMSDRAQRSRLLNVVAGPGGASLLLDVVGLPGRFRIHVDLEGERPKSVGAAGRTFDVDIPCPRCGTTSIIGYLFLDQHGKHQHTHYVCTFWRSPDRSVYFKLGYDASKDRCGWHGRSVPDSEEEPGG